MRPFPIRRGSCATSRAPGHARYGAARWFEPPRATRTAAPSVQPGVAPSSAAADGEEFDVDAFNDAQSRAASWTLERIFARPRRTVRGVIEAMETLTDSSWRGRCTSRATTSAGGRTCAETCSSLGGRSRRDARRRHDQRCRARDEPGDQTLARQSVRSGLPGGMSARCGVVATMGGETGIGFCARHLPIAFAGVDESRAPRPDSRARVCSRSFFQALLIYVPMILMISAKRRECLGKREPAITSSFNISSWAAWSSPLLSRFRGAGRLDACPIWHMMSTHCRAEAHNPLTPG